MFFSDLDTATDVVSHAHSDVPSMEAMRSQLNYFLVLGNVSGVV